MAPEFDHVACVIGTVSDMDAFEDIHHLYYYVLGLSSSQLDDQHGLYFFVLVLSVYLDSGWYAW